MAKKYQRSAPDDGFWESSKTHPVAASDIILNHDVDLAGVSLSPGSGDF
jgi:hypothetical protein